MMINFDGLQQTNVAVVHKSLIVTLVYCVNGLWRNHFSILFFHLYRQTNPDNTSYERKRTSTSASASTFRQKV